jgi:hypothetical protein
MIEQLVKGCWVELKNATVMRGAGNQYDVFLKGPGQRNPPSMHNTDDSRQFRIDRMISYQVIRMDDLGLELKVLI